MELVYTLLGMILTLGFMIFVCVVIPAGIFMILEPKKPDIITIDLDILDERAEGRRD